MTIKLLGSGHYLPESILTNADFEKTLDTSDEWIVKRTGIRERRICKEESLFDMALSAARSALHDAAGAHIDAIIVSTASPDYYFPSLACRLGTALGFDGITCFDISATCSGFVYALDNAARFINTDGADTVLIVSAEKLSSILDYSDRSTCILFGDAAAAAVVTKGGSQYYSHLAFSADPEDSIYTKIGGFMQMNGSGVYKFAVATVPTAIETVLEKAALSPGDIDWFLLHQANSRIIDSIIDRLGLDPAKVPITIDLFANTSSASIPLMLDLMRKDGRIVPGQRVLLAGFGAGLTYAASIWEV